MLCMQRALLLPPHRHAHSHPYNLKCPGPQSEPGRNSVFAFYDVLLYLYQMTKLAQRIHFLFPYVAYTQCIKSSRECHMGEGRA